nr:MAG TPA: hypothetical protein [Caudoviricetes sp.]
MGGSQLNCHTVNPGTVFRIWHYNGSFHRALLFSVR